MEKKKTVKTKKKKSGKGKILFLIYLLGVLAVYLVFFIFYSAFISVSLFIPSFELPENYTVAIAKEGSDKNIDSYSVSKKNAARDGEIYVNFSWIADICRFPVSGDTEKLRYKIVSSDGEVQYMTVYLEGGRVFINENPVNIRTGVRYISGEVYLPMSFVDEYISGIDISFDGENKKVKVILDNEFSLKLRDSESLENIDVSEL